MAKKDVWAIMSGMGVGVSILDKLVIAAKKHGCTEEDVHRLATPEGEPLIEQFATIMAQNRVCQESFTVTIDYTQSLADMIRAGNYDWVNEDITQEHFPIQGERRQEVTVTLFHFNRSVSSGDAIAGIKQQGYRPGEIEHLLALGAAHPDLQKQFPIIALGSVWSPPGGSRCVPSVPWRGAGRSLHLLWFDGAWRPSCRFIAVSA